MRAEGGLVQVNGHTRVVGDATWSHRPRETTGVELILAGDLVGTRQALEEGIAYGLAGASVEQQFGHRFTGVAMAGWQPFTDGNSRALLRARMIWSLLPEQGLSAQLRWRQYSSSDADVGGAYFNPDRYRTWDAVLSLRRRVGAWTVAGLAGGGQERVDDGSWQSTGVAEVVPKVRCPRDMRLAVNAAVQQRRGFRELAELLVRLRQRQRDRSVRALIRDGVYSAATMPTYVALLRGVNVGKAKRVPMADLRDVLAGLGCTESRRC